LWSMTINKKPQKTNPLSLVLCITAEYDVSEIPKDGIIKRWLNRKMVSIPCTVCLDCGEASFTCVY
jgi:aconitase B